MLRKLYEKAFNRQSSQELAIFDEKGRKALNIIALNLNMPTSAISQKASFFELGGNSVRSVSLYSMSVNEAKNRNQNRQTQLIFHSCALILKPIDNNMLFNVCLPEKLLKSFFPTSDCLQLLSNSCDLF